ncbi:ABC transporter ATP-binding protein/permease [Chloroflexi bacterium TSY]|nr:ABC transporter ATP-binding protein/permease [Chloroflexi bacterium TSY]
MNQSSIWNSQSSLSNLQAHDYRRLAFFRPQHFFLTLLGWILFSLTPLVLGYLSQQIFDTLSGDARLGLNVWTLLALLLLANFVNEGILLGWIYRQNMWEGVMMSLIRTNLFDTMLRRFGRYGHRVGAAARISPGDAVSRYRDDIEGTSDIVNEWYRLIGHGLFAIVALTVMVRIDPLVTLAAILPLSGIVIVAHQLNARLAAAWKRSREDTSRVTSFISEAFGAVQAVKVAVAEQSVTRQFHRLNDGRRQAALQFTLIRSIIGSFNVNIINIGRGLVLLLAASAIQAGTFTVGDFTLFVIYLFEFLELPRRVGRLLATRKTCAVSSNRLVELMEGGEASSLVTYREIYLGRDEEVMRAEGGGSEPIRKVVVNPTNFSNENTSSQNFSDKHLSEGRGGDDRQGLSETEGGGLALERLDVHGLTYRYNDEDDGIENVNLSLQQGTITVITGRVGAGKSTLLRVLLGLLPLDAGEILWNGTVVTDPASFFVPPHVAYTPQLPRLFSDTLRENILLGMPEDPHTLDRVIQSAVFETDVAQMGQGLDTLIGPRGVRLSGGQVQRAAAARMFVREPELLVFDDLSSALDVETEQKLWQRLFHGESGSNGQPTCLVVSHRRTVLQRADQIIVMQGGRVVDQGELHELLERCDEMQGLWDSMEVAPKNQPTLPRHKTHPNR